MNINPPVIGQSGLVKHQQEQSIATAINGNLETSNTETMDTNGWPDTFSQANTLQTTIRVGATGSSPASGVEWTAANTKIPHNLGKIPTGWHIVYQDKAVTIIAGTPAPDIQFIYLTVSDDTANTTLIIF